MIRKIKYKEVAIVAVLCLAVVIAVIVMIYKQHAHDTKNSDTISVNKQNIYVENLVRSEVRDTKEDSEEIENGGNANAELPIARDKHDEIEAVNGSTLTEEDKALGFSDFVNEKNESNILQNSAISDGNSGLVLNVNNSNVQNNSESMNSKTTMYDGDKADHELPLVMVN